MTTIITAENAILSIAPEFLPAEARTVRTGGELSLVERVTYQTWLAEQLETVFRECECRICREGVEGIRDGYDGCAAYEASNAADEARDAAIAALGESDEEREYEIRDENATWEITSRPSTLADDVAESVRDGDWDLSEGGFRWSGYAHDTLTGEDTRHTVQLDQPEPACREAEHKWVSPHELLGGISENPGVWGKGGGVIIREVCAHCGCYRVTDTWSQDPSTGEQGFASVAYEDADEDSIAWLAAQLADEIDADE